MKHWRHPSVLLVAVLIVGGLYSINWFHGHRAEVTRPTPPQAGLGAPTALSRLKVAEPGSTVPYNRARFGNSEHASRFTWADLDHDGCNTREETMADDLTNKTIVGGCNVVAGDLTDPYTGQKVHYTEAPPYEVQIDHTVSLAEAWRHGAAGWTWEKRREFANDPSNLVATSAPVNEAKGDDGPAEWLPHIRDDLKCAYVRRYTKEAYEWRLTVTKDDKAALQHTFANDC